MAGSLMTRLRARIEELQGELQPEAGFDRSAYGYNDEAGEDATFEDVDIEEESPWRRPGGAEERPGPEPEATARAPDGGRSPAARGTETAPRRGAAGSPRASVVPEPSPARRERSVSPWHRGAAAGARVPGGDPSSPPREAAVRGPPEHLRAAAARPAERERARGTSRLRRIHRRIRQPGSLRELFLLREVIDRPVALRGRPRGRRTE